MRISFIAYSEQGCSLAARIAAFFPEDSCTLHTIEKFASHPGFTAHKSLCADTGALFRESDALIFVCACGIAVRNIAPHLKNKQTDPAVLVIDDCGRFVIPILSGHIGGGNRLAKLVAEKIGSKAAVTTATDVNGKFSADEWAARKGFLISSMKAAKEISAAILSENVGFVSEFPCESSLPEGLVATSGNHAGIIAGIRIGVRTDEPFPVTLRLIPRVVTLGIGCRRGTSCEAIEKAVDQVLREYKIDFRSVSNVASIDVKANEPGLRSFCAGHGLPLRFYTAAELKAVSGAFSPSAFVEKTVGVDNVCERAAVCSEKDEGEEKELIVQKTVLDGVTVAAAVKRMVISFE